MRKPHDLGGAPESAPLERDDGPPFAHEWEARVFALNRLLLRRGLYTLDEFRFSIERMNPEAYRAASYYERWLDGIERLLAEKGILA